MESHRRLIIDIRLLPRVPRNMGLRSARNETPHNRCHTFALGNRKNRVEPKPCFRKELRDGMRFDSTPVSGCRTNLVGWSMNLLSNGESSFPAGCGRGIREQADAEHTRLRRTGNRMIGSSRQHWQWCIGSNVGSAIGLSQARDIRIYRCNYWTLTQHYSCCLPHSHGSCHSWSHALRHPCSLKTAEAHTHMSARPCLIEPTSGTTSFCVGTTRLVLV